MPHEIHRTAYPAIAASIVNARAAVALAAAASGVGDRGVVPIATLNVEPLGVALATAAAVGDALTVHDDGNTVIALAGASLGAGADVGVASTNGALGPVAGASGSVVFRVGKSTTSADADQTFSLYVKTRKLSGSP